MEEIEREAHVAIGKASEDIERKVVVDLTKVKEKLKRLSPLSFECSIYKVPKRIRERNSKAYTPQVVSIGPFHHGKEHLKVMEEHKLRYLKSFLNRTERGLEYYFEVGKKWEEEARHFYAEAIKLNSDNFVKMMLVDGSFIVECLLRNMSPELEDNSDRLFNKPWMYRDVVDDMLLLENQLPFFVVERLFNQVSIQEGKPSFLEHVKEFFVGPSIIEKIPDIVSNPKIQHFVGFLHCSYLQSFQEEQCHYEKTYCCPPTVSELEEAGIKFKKKTNCSPIDIKFSNETLEIPQLLISDSTETLLRNLIAFEDCHFTNRQIINYAHLLYNMIKTTKDVDLLIQHEILGGVDSSRKCILRIFENIGTGVSADTENFHWNSLSEKLKAHCGITLNKLKATLKRDYLNTILNAPWKVLSVSLALAVFILTTIQAVCSLISL